MNLLQKRKCLKYDFSLIGLIQVLGHYDFVNIVGKPTPSGILQKKRKNENENFQRFIKNSYNFQILIPKTSILSDHEKVVFILIY